MGNSHSFQNGGFIRNGNDEQDGAFDACAAKYVFLADIAGDHMDSRAGAAIDGLRIEFDDAVLHLA